MASIKDAFEEAFQDNFAVLKYILFALPIFYCIYLYYAAVASKDFSGFWCMTSVTFLLLFGFLIKCTTNVRNGKDHVLPSFNIFNLLWAGFKGVIALGPSIAVNCFLASFIGSKVAQFFPDPNIAGIFQGIIWAVFISVILTGYLLYSKKFKISDAYDFKTISNSCMDILIAVLFFIPQLLILNALIIGAVTYVFWVFLGIPNTFCTFFWCMALVFNLAVIGHYMAQIDYEAIEAKSEKDL